VGPTDREWRRGSLYKGDGEGVSMEKKREGDREAAGEVFLSSDPLYHCFFGRYITVFFGIGMRKGSC
jgi:hypothetical protein